MDTNNRWMVSTWGVYWGALLTHPGHNRVYGVFDPDTDRLLYVGKTHTSRRARWAVHDQDAKRHVKEGKASEFDLWVLGRSEGEGAAAMRFLPFVSERGAVDFFGVDGLLNRRRGNRYKLPKEDAPSHQDVQPVLDGDIAALARGRELGYVGDRVRTFQRYVEAVREFALEENWVSVEECERARERLVVGCALADDEA